MSSYKRAAGDAAAEAEKNRQQRDDEPEKKRHWAGEMTSSSTTNSDSFINPEFQYDVFINFRGDTRKCFVGHLYSALKQRDVRAYLDSVELEKGESINDLFMAIERSAVFITVFSKRYAESRWCLKEIKKIVDCKRRIFPIFFDVEPSELRHQTGAFSEAFSNHQVNQDVETVKLWKEALREVATISGYVLEEDYHGDEAKLINDVVARVFYEVYSKNPVMEIAEHPVGMDDHVQKMTALLQTDQVNEVRFIGICGIGGLGKTTIANATYNKFKSEFDCSSFLANVRERATRQDGLVHLQKELTCGLFNDNDPHITNTSAGIQSTRKRVQSKKVLVILDDVDKTDQIHYLVGDGSWLKKGSRVIITTRKKDVLTGLLDDHIYIPDKLNQDQSLDLFGHFAFKRGKPIDEHLQLAREVIESIGRLPLSLKVLGSHFSIFKIDEWRFVLEKLKQVPHEDVQSILRLSYDGLTHEEKQIFLDIACFLLEHRDERKIRGAISMWEACRFYPKVSIPILEQRSLVERYKGGQCFKMHDEIRKMAREIVRQENPSKPWVRSRVWEHREAVEAMTDFEGLGNVETLLFDPKHEALNITTKSLLAMPNLRMFDVSTDNGSFHYDFDEDSFGRELQSESRSVIGHSLPQPKWLRWPKYPYEELPQQVLNPDQLAVLELPCFEGGYLRLNLSRAKEFHYLRILSLARSNHLVCTPDFSLMPHLEKLTFRECNNLHDLSPSIGQLKKLAELDLRSCQGIMILPEEMCHCTSLTKLLLNSTSISELPKSFSKLRLLQELFLSDCTRLSALPGDIGNLTSLSKLNLYCTSIREFPESFSCLKMLKELNVDYCKLLKELPSTIGSNEQLEKLSIARSSISELPKSLGRLKSLNTLEISYCPIVTLPEEMCCCTSITLLNCSNCDRLSSLPRDIGNLTSLSTLHLTGTGICELPDSFSRLTMLQMLTLNKCKLLKKLPESMPKLHKLSLSGCESLEKLPESIARMPCSQIYLSGCKKLKKLPDTIGALQDLDTLALWDCSSLLDAKIDQLTTLHTLSLIGCGSLAPTFMRRLRQGNFTNMRHFSISGRKPSEVQQLPFRNHAQAVLQFTLPNIVGLFDGSKNDRIHFILDERSVRNDRIHFILDERSVRSSSQFNGMAVGFPDGQLCIKMVDFSIIAGDHRSDESEAEKLLKNFLVGDKNPVDVWLLRSYRNWKLAIALLLLSISEIGNACISFFVGSANSSSSFSEVWNVANYTISMLKIWYEMLTLDRRTTNYSTYGTDDGSQFPAIDFEVLRLDR